jgi:hypothetical protein
MMVSFVVVHLMFDYFEVFVDYAKLLDF